MIQQDLIFIANNLSNGIFSIITQQLKDRHIITQKFFSFESSYQKERRKILLIAMNKIYSEKQVEALHDKFVIKLKETIVKSIEKVKKGELDAHRVIDVCFSRKT